MGRGPQRAPCHPHRGGGTFLGRVTPEKPADTGLLLGDAVRTEEPMVWGALNDVRCGAAVRLFSPGEDRNCGSGVRAFLVEAENAEKDRPDVPSPEGRDALDFAVGELGRDRADGDELDERLGTEKVVRERAEGLT